jgi:hypothetical protein
MFQDKPALGKALLDGLFILHASFFDPFMIHTIMIQAFPDA